MERRSPNFESGALVFPVFSCEFFYQSRARIDKVVAVITLPRSKRVTITEGGHNAAGPVGNGIMRSAQGYVG